MRIKYEVGELWVRLRSAHVFSSEKLLFEPLNLRRNARVQSDDFKYSIQLQYRNGWLTKYSDQLDDTIFRLLRNEERRILFQKLIRKFRYVEKYESQRLVDDIVWHIESVWKCKPDDSVIVAVTKTKNRHPDGAAVLIYRLQDEMKSWNNDRFITPFMPTCRRVRGATNIILCDDFIGSGYTIENRVKWIKKYLRSQQRLFVVSVAGMENAKSNKLDTLPINYFAPVWLKQGINQEEDEDDVRIMLDMENLLAPKYKDYKLETMTLGYGKSGGLYFNEEYRIPNNVYPIFWWGKLKDGADFKSIFLRS